MISLNYRDSRPIYEQIKDGLKKLIVTGGLAADERLPSVRALATQLSINPNTIQRALSDLEREGFVYSKRTTGRFVTEDLDLILQSRKQLSEEQLQQFVSCMLQFGYKKEELPNVLSDYIKGV